MAQSVSNHLAGETSAYLLQHAENPVEWHPWGPEALERACREDRPILLSIGYSACHWCHVMAHESFEDTDTAALMNRLFVNIKVDREERPDLDRIYQLAHQVLARRPGGWPLTVVLTPDDLLPFFAGTYFPREARHGLPAFGDLLRQIADVYHNRRDEISAQNRSLAQLLSSLQPADSAATLLDAAPLHAAVRMSSAEFDAAHGGFGRAPKFPQPMALVRLLRYALWRGADPQLAGDARRMLGGTLDGMARGGIYDQIGGGFCRYSVDERWEIPHFEKMLYDNGPLLGLYAAASRLTGDSRYTAVANETADWVLREMQAPGGGYYSTLDADSEGAEGAYYVWEQAELRACLDEREYAVAAACLGFDTPPNFEGKWHARRVRDPAEISTADFVESPDRVFARARARLFAARERRVRPGRDEKRIVSWNALMAGAMATAGRTLSRAELIDSAQQAVDFVARELWRDGRLCSVFAQGRARFAGYLDDYAFMIDALLELLQARWRRSDLDFAIGLADALLAHFEDAEAGGFYFTADDHERLIHRPKPFSDDSVPAGNGVAARGLARLGHLLGASRYLEAAQRAVQAAGASLRRAPHAHNALLDALEELLEPPQLVVLRGGASAVAAWRAICEQEYRPDRLVFSLPLDAADLPGVLGAQSIAGAYVCSGTACSAPTTDTAVLRNLLSGAGAVR